MKTLKLLAILFFTAFVLSSCFGDKKVVDVTEMNDTSSFINKNFKGNLINYSKDMSACEQMSTGDIAALYSVSVDMVVIEDVSKSDRRVPNSAPSCMFYIKTGANDFEWLRGSLSIDREIGKGEANYENAKMAGNGEEFEEAWALRKSMSKSSEWVKNAGLAALWNDRKKELAIKFKGYTLNIYPIKNRLNKAEVARKRDYKQMAIKMAKASGFIN